MLTIILFTIGLSGGIAMASSDDNSDTTNQSEQSLDTSSDIYCSPRCNINITLVVIFPPDGLKGCTLFSFQNVLKLCEYGDDELYMRCSGQHINIFYCIKNLVACN